MTTVPTDWMKPGRTLQAAVAIIASEAERDSSGRFVTHPTAAEIVLKGLRKAYSPPLAEPQNDAVPLDAVEGKILVTERTGAHRESGETNWRATGGSARKRAPETAAETGPHPSIFHLLRISAALIGICAVWALGFAPHWMPENMLIQFIGGTTVAMAGGVEIAVAMGVL